MFVQLFVSTLFMFSLLSASEVEHPLICVAHRGASAEAPENTLAAFRRAVEIGADYMEFDVQLSADGTPVVFHDDTLTRTTNDKSEQKVTEVDYSTLKTLDAGSWFSEAFRDERIPTLAEVLSLPRGKTGLMIELKGEDVDADTLVPAVLEAVAVATPQSSPILFTSFSAAMVHMLLAANLPHRVMANANTIAGIDEMLETDVDILCVRHNFVSAELVGRAHKKGKEVWCYTVNDPTEMRSLRNEGVAAIITDDPQIFFAS